MEENQQEGIQFEELSPNWKAEGAEPRAELNEGGVMAGYRPPAGYFNWFWTRVSRCISELQAKLSACAANLQTHSQNEANPHGVTAVQVKALPLTGGTMTGQIGLGEQTAIRQEEGIINLQANKVNVWNKTVTARASVEADYFASSRSNGRTVFGGLASANGSIFYLTTGEMIITSLTEARSLDLTGKIYKPVRASAFPTSSSQKYKKDIVDLSEETAMKLLQLRPRQYRLKQNNNLCYGFIAEEVNEVDDTSVVLGSDLISGEVEIDALNYNMLLAPLLKLLQMQQTQIGNMQKQLELLKVEEAGI